MIHPAKAKGLARPESPKRSDQPRSTETVREALARWLVVQGIGKRPATQKHQRECALIIERNFGGLDRPASEISEQECEEFMLRISRYSPSRFNGTLHAFRKILPQASHIPQKKAGTEEKTILTQEEFDRLLVELDMSHRGNAGLVVRLLALTGMRINEARHLRWVDVKEDHIFVPGRFSKNGKPRSIPLMNGVEQVLEALRRISTGELVLPHKSCANALRLAAKRCGLPRMGHHAFRHLFATRCIMSGVDVPTVAKWLGHSDNGALLLRTYCHLMDSHSRTMAGRVQIEARMPKAPAPTVIPAPSAQAKAASRLPVTPPTSSGKPAIFTGHSFDHSFVPTLYAA